MLSGPVVNRSKVFRHNLDTTLPEMPTDAVTVSYVGLLICKERLEKECFLPSA